MTTSFPVHRRHLLAGGALLPLLAAAGCADPTTNAATTGGNAGSDGGGDSAAGSPFDTSGTQERITSEVDESLAAELPQEIRDRGTVIVGTTAGGTPPLSFLADDNTTTIGAEVDIAHLAADKLGLEVDLQLTSWENWPLKLESHEYDAVFSNVGINAERLKKFDFASYRAAFMAFLTKKGADSDLQDADSISGKIIAVGNATNQEQILKTWNAQLEEDGKEPAELKNYQSDADVQLALGSGRVDAYFAPFPTVSYTAAVRDDVEVQGKVDAGWPDQTLVAATFLAGSGLVDVFAKALQAVIDDGTYGQVLERWGLEEEALTESTAHTEENP
jgi:polar amino acid transport system substrate-binding protein